MKTRLKASSPNYFFFFFGAAFLAAFFLAGMRYASLLDTFSLEGRARAHGRHSRPITWMMAMPSTICCGYFPGMSILFFKKIVALQTVLCLGAASYQLRCQASDLRSQISDFRFQISDSVSCAGSKLIPDT
jgi:hypothetical protein